jgi:hypothetical protein
MIRTGRPVAEIMCLLCNTFLFRTAEPRFWLYTVAEAWIGPGPVAGLSVSSQFILSPAGPLGILPAAFFKVTDTTKGPP